LLTARPLRSVEGGRRRLWMTLEAIKVEKQA